MPVVILYGTETGTAEDVSDAVADVLAEHADVSSFDMSDYEIDDLNPENFYVIVSSTYGDGELPSSALPFFDDLDEVTPDLTGIRFAVFGMGDRVYEDTFNRGGEICAEKLTALGAEQVGDHARHDASSSIKPKDQAQDWAKTIVEFLDA